jgi:hypothetical protein
LDIALLTVRLTTDRCLITLLAIVILQAQMPTTAIAAEKFPLSISNDGKQLLDTSGVPYLINGAAPWSLAVVPNRAELDLYLDDRKSKGFNAIIVNAIEHKFGGPANSSGDEPFLKNGDFSTPNDAYFDHVEWIIHEAAVRDMLVFLSPAYLGYQCGDEGWCQEILRASPAVLRDYGRYLGSRFVGHPNIVWVNGGDVDAAAYGALDAVNEIVIGITETDAVHLHTAHCGPGRSALDCYDTAWLDINTTYVRDCATVALHTRKDSQRTRAMPFLLFEGLYENEDASATCLRWQAYTSILGGSVGHAFGNKPIWFFGDGWQSALDSDGAKYMQVVAALFQSRARVGLQPDWRSRLVRFGQGRIDTPRYASAALASDRSSMIVYVPDAREIIVDTRSLTGSEVAAWHYDPTSGNATSLGVRRESSNQTYASTEESDWVLVLDNHDLGLPPPGTSIPVANGNRE